MGYQLRRKQYLLKFRDPEYNGLEVVMGSMSMREWEALVAPAPADPAERAAAHAADLALFVDRLVSWNLEDNGVPVPVTADAVRDLDRPFFIELTTAWQLALVGVDPTSGSASSSGATPPAMPQEPITAESLEAMTAPPGTSGPMT